MKSATKDHVSSSVTESLNALYDMAGNTTAEDISIDNEYSALVPPVNFSSAYAYDNEQALGAYHLNKLEHHRYSRDSNPLVTQLEKIFTSFYGMDTVLFSSGMNAVWSVLWSTITQVDTYVTMGSYYRKTHSNIDSICKGAGKINLHYQDIDELLASGTDSSSTLVYLESPSNPFLKIIDIELVRESYPNAIIVYDNTLAGLFNDKKSLQLVDYVVYSCTKYIGGHNDVIAGAVATGCGNRHQLIWDVRSSQGGILDPMSAFLLFRSLKTYDIRIATIHSNVEEVLSFLDSHPSVEEIYYPGRFCNSADLQTFNDCYRLGGGVVTFLAQGVVDFSSLHSCKMAPSFGSTDSLIERPASMSHAGKSDAELTEVGLKQNHVRLSVGMEPVDYVLRDINRLLESDIKEN